MTAGKQVGDPLARLDELRRRRLDILGAGGGDRLLLPLIPHRKRHIVNGGRREGEGASPDPGDSPDLPADPPSSGGSAPRITDDPAASQLYEGDAGDGVLITLQKVGRVGPSGPHARVSHT